MYIEDQLCRCCKENLSWIKPVKNFAVVYLVIVCMGFFSVLIISTKQISSLVFSSLLSVNVKEI